MSSVSVASGLLTFTGTSGQVAIARAQLTTAEPDECVTFSFEVERQPMTIQIGSTAGGQDIIADAVFLPGEHVISFTPDTGTYFLEFQMAAVGTGYVRNFAAVSAGDVSVPTPYAEDDLPFLRFDQSFNTMWFAGAGEMQVLERRGAQSFSFRPWLQIDGPFSPLNLSSTTLTASARTGTATLTASGPLFRGTDAGSLLRVTHTGQFVTSDLDGVDAVTDAIEVTGVEQSRTFSYSIAGTFSGTVVLERSIGNEFTYATVSSHTSPGSFSFNDELDNQVIYYRLRCTAFTSGAAVSSLTYSAGVTDGIARVITVDADNAVTADIIRPFGRLTASSLWNFGAWSNRFGHPAAVGLFDGRLWTARGAEYWASASDDFSSFDVGPLPAQAIARSFSGRMSSSRWLKGASRMLAGLSGFEAEISSNALQDVIIPENVRSRGLRTRGSATMDPVLVDDTVAFVSRSKERLYAISAIDNGSVDVVDLTRLNRDIAGVGGFKQIDYQQEPEPRIWCVREDGQVAVLVFDQEEQVAAWCRMAVDGFVESVCCLPRTPEDHVYFVVRRTVNGQTVRYIEQLAVERWTDLQEANRLHSSVVYSGSATTSLTGLSHLESRNDVYVWGNGRESGPYTVSSGSITLETAVTYAVAGLRYSGKYKSGRMNWGGDRGSGLTTNKQLERVGYILFKTAGGAVEFGGSFDGMERIPDRKTDDDVSLTFDGPVQIFDEDAEIIIEDETSRDARLHIRMSTAGPATVLGIAPMLDTKGG